MDRAPGRQGNLRDIRLRPAWGGVFALLLAATLAASLSAAGGCGWFRWRALARTHVELLERTGRDAADAYVAPGGALGPGDIERLRYPLERAREFALTSRRRFGDADWLVRFDALLAAYADLSDWLDRARTQPVTDAEREQARARTARLLETASSARTALDEPAS